MVALRWFHPLLALIGGLCYAAFATTWLIGAKG